MRFLAWLLALSVAAGCGGDGSGGPDSGTDGASGGAADEGPRGTGTTADGPSGSNTSAADATTGETSTGPGMTCGDLILPEARGCSEDTPHPECDEVNAPAIDAEAGMLLRFAGQYTRGDAPVYAGSLSASLTGPMGDEQADEDLLAATTVHETGLPGATFDETRLYAFFLSAEQKIWFGQGAEPTGTTRLNPLRPLLALGGSTMACVGCVDSLAAAPQDILLNVSVTGPYGTAEETHSAAVDGTLSRVAAQDLSLDQLHVLRYAYGGSDGLPSEGFEELDDEVVLLRESQVRVPYVPSPAGYTQCSEVIEYTTQWFFDPECVGEHGFRDFEVLSRQLCCQPDTKDPGGSECFDFDFD